MVGGALRHLRRHCQGLREATRAVRRRAAAGQRLCQRVTLHCRDAVIRKRLLADVGDATACGVTGGVCLRVVVLASPQEEVWRLAALACQLLALPFCAD